MKKCCKSRKITQEQLAEEIGGSDRNIRYIENGDSRPSYDTLQNICFALKITVESICIPTEKPEN